jgi:orotate phosphoribosyltransferase
VYAKKADGWYHGTAYVNKDAIYPHTRFVSPLCKEIADHFWGNDVDVVVGPTVGGVSLSQWVAHWYAPFSYQNEVLAVYADEEDVFEEHNNMKYEEFVHLLKYEFAPGIIITAVNAPKTEVVSGDTRFIEEVSFKIKVGTKRILKRGYDKIVKDKRCLIVEDIINSGITVQKTVKAIREAGGEVIGVGSLCNRSGGKVTANTLDVPELTSLLELDMQMFKEEECPICKEKGPESVRLDLGKGKEFLVRTTVV